MEKSVETVLPYLPSGVAEEVLRVVAKQENAPAGVSEIRLRADGVCALVLNGKNVPLSVSVGQAETEETLRRLCGGSLYAYRDMLAEGYLPMGNGIRVGLCGRARYESGRLVGISDVRSLVFRIPHRVCDAADTLYREWCRGVRRGMLIFSPPGGGKTTALRALAGRLGTGAGAKRVCVIDEREEFSPDDYRHTSVDVFRGYHRDVGMEIAVRTMSPEVLMVDEIGGEGEARAMLDALRSGIPLIATAHAATVDDVKKKKNLSPFLACDIFDVFCGLCRTESGIVCHTERLP